MADVACTTWRLQMVTLVQHDQGTRFVSHKKILFSEKILIAEKRIFFPSLILKTMIDHNAVDITCLKLFPIKSFSSMFHQNFNP